MTYHITHSGKKINLETISEDDICLSDIAHHLTKICRYGGALPFNVWYSVAQHSIQLANYSKANGYSKEIQAVLLLHDASEAYLGDIISSVKPKLLGYSDLESKVARLIETKYNLTIGSDDREVNEVVKELDTRIVLDEAKFLFPSQYEKFTAQMPGVQELGIKIFPETNLESVYYAFLYLCAKLGIKD